MIHGWTGSIEEWSTVVGPLNDNGFRTLVMDCPGHGNSDAPEARDVYTMHALADLHYDAAKTLGVMPAVVIGFSMGGAIAEEYALRHPDDALGIVLLGSAGGDWIDSEAESDIKEALPIAFSQGMEALWEIRAKRLYPEEFKQLSEDERNKRRTHFANTSPEGYIYTLYGLLEKRNTFADMVKFGKPALIIHGEGEEESIIKSSKRLHSAIQESHYVVIPDAGHFAQCDNADAFNQELVNFLKNL
jgi:pimeloyl-ACP methyl ester carboxylesterase